MAEKFSFQGKLPADICCLFAFRFPTCLCFRWLSTKALKVSCYALQPFQSIYIFPSRIRFEMGMVGVDRYLIGWFIGLLVFVTNFVSKLLPQFLNGLQWHVVCFISIKSRGGKHLSYDWVHSLQSYMPLNIHM